jgi:hypothetical protein
MSNRSDFSLTHEQRRKKVKESYFYGAWREFPRGRTTPNDITTFEPSGKFRTRTADQRFAQVIQTFLFGDGLEGTWALEDNGKKLKLTAKTATEKILPAHVPAQITTGILGTLFGITSASVYRIIEVDHNTFQLEPSFDLPRAITGFPVTFKRIV